MLAISKFSLVLALCTVMVSALFQSRSSSTSVKALKSELLSLVKKVNRGLSETPEERLKIKELFEKLEKKNPNKSTLKNPALSAMWSLEYTTSDRFVLSSRSIYRVCC